MCVDYRKINKVSKFDACPMPNVQEILDEVGPAKFISTLDLAQGYWQVPMAADSQKVTVFTMPYGLFGFGLHNAPATFQRMMNEVLRDCSAFSKSCIDDVVVFSQTWEEHLQHLWAVFTCLQQANLSMKLRKCQFALKKVGYVVGEGRIEPDPRKSRQSTILSNQSQRVKLGHSMALLATTGNSCPILLLMQLHLQSY